MRDEKRPSSVSNTQHGGAPGGMVGYVAADELAKIEHKGHRNRVDGAVSLLAPGDDAGAGEDPQLLGRVGLLDLELLDQFPHAGRPGLEALENPQPSRFGEDGKEFGDCVELGRLKRGMVLPQGSLSGSFGIFHRSPA